MCIVPFLLSFLPPLFAMVLWGLREKEGRRRGVRAAQCSSGWAAVAVVAEVFACLVGWLGVSHSACFTLCRAHSPPKRLCETKAGRQPRNLMGKIQGVRKERKGSIFEFGHYCQIKTNDAAAGQKQHRDSATKSGGTSMKRSIKWCSPGLAKFVLAVALLILGPS